MSNDNAYAEALFRTAKYCPLWPQRPFDTLEEARDWVTKFVAWYNEEHRHSALKYVTPAQCHQGLDAALLQRRDQLYGRVQRQRPERWSGATRDWRPIGHVYLNRERDQAALKAA